MRCLFVIDSLGSGGAQRQMVSLALSMIDRGHEVDFFVYYPQYNFYAPALEAKRVPIHRWQKVRRFDPGPIIAIRNRINQGSYDVVLSFLEIPTLYCEIACLRKDLPRLVVSERIADLGAGPPMWKRALEQLHRRADAITVNSHWQAERMVKRSPWIRARLRVIYNGVDLSVYSPRDEASPQPGTLLVVGSVIPRKNVVGLVSALVVHHETYGYTPEVHWVGAVQDSRHSRAEYHVASKILAAHNLEHRWRWLGERDDLWALYPRYSALIHPSLREGLPNVVCEAMACGLPVLISNIGELPLLVGDGERGFLFDPTSPREIACVMHQFMSLSEGAKESMRRSARCFAQREFDIVTTTTNYVELFSQVLGHRR